MVDYIGRFAPSPTGHLHLGSLVAAVGSYVRAKNRNGQWLVRMEDLDPLREESEAKVSILQDLERHGLHWDGDVEFQSQRQSYYEAALDALKDQDLVYPCYCSRKFLIATAERGEFGMIYPGHCRNGAEATKAPSIRVRTHNDPLCFNDLTCGELCQRLESALGDFIVKRSDGYIAYQLAVVVDDHGQGITEVVRGADLLGNTPRQIHLQQLLGYETPEYFHLPLMMNDQGQKLSKQTHAPGLEKGKEIANLEQVLRFLAFDIGKDESWGSVDELLIFAVKNSPDWLLAR
ncbi:MAG: glutamyl-Q-tRNA synthetase [uncultured Thiotrichaceae bacterium]|uniref:Glutamyl-Q tRNA(Asp) synthetase n=1 Tax=uncultured Thiotrichaceae bacterium TaxID=298394 RepID=A0A6S6TYW3_9GAMM|nr:MAG: glutamyl-Q-tRNA synthetase [uncultured Thiotrichaceae bacterium]